MMMPDLLPSAINQFYVQNLVRRASKYNTRYCFDRVSIAALQVVRQHHCHWPLGWWPRLVSTLLSGSRRLSGSVTCHWPPG